MARVAVAYVEVRPDLTGFGRKLQDQLKTVAGTAKVKAAADDASAIAAGKRVGKKAGEEAGKSMPKTMVEHFKAATASLGQQLAVDTAYAARLAAKDFRTEFGANQLVSDDMEYKVVRRLTQMFGNAGTQAGRAMVREHNTAVRKLLAEQKKVAKQARDVEWFDARKMGRDVNKGLKGISGALGRSNVIGRALGLSFEAAGKAASAMGEVIGDVLEVAGVGAKTATKGVDALGSAMGDATKAAAGMGSAGAKMGSEFVATFSVMGSLVGTVAALAGGFAIVTTVVGALQVGLAAALAIAIPLVAAITALVAELVALGAVVAGSLSILPGVLGAALAAFGPLMLVADKFQKLMEDTSTHTGELFVAMERLKNAIFAVISSGFIEAVSTFVSNVLPKFFGQLDAVAQAWNRVLLAVIKLASQADVVNGINAMLATGAKLVDAMGAALETMGPALLSFAVAALPAVEDIVASFADLIDYMASWMSIMAKSGVAQGVFRQIATIVAGVVDLFKQLLPLVWDLFEAAKGPAVDFLAILGGLASTLHQMFSSAAGQTALITFFSSANNIVAELSQVFVDLLPMVLQFGDTISTSLTHAAPLLETIAGIFNEMLTQIMPGLNVFIDQMNAALSDPRVQVALALLADSLSSLFATMADTSTVLAFIQIMTWLVDIINGAIQVVNWLNELMSDTHAIAIMRLAMGDVAGAVKAFAADTAGAGNSVQTKLNGLTGAFNTFGNTVGNVSQGSADSLTRFANLKSWSVIQNNMVVIAQGMEALGAAASGGTKEWRNIGTKVGAMKQVLQKAEREQADAFKKLGTSAGSSFMAGYNAAVTTKAGAAAKKGSTKTAAGWLTNLKPALGKIDILSMLKAPQFYDTGREMATLLAKGITSGGANIKKVSGYIYKYMKPTLTNLTSKLKSFGTTAAGLIGKALPSNFAAKLKSFKSIPQLDAYLKYYQDHWQTVLDGIDDFKAKAVDALTKGANLVGYFGFIPTPQEVQAQLNDHLQRMTRFTADLAELQKRGLSKELAAQWLQAGVDQAGNLVEGLRDASRGQLEAISGQFANINAQANTQAQAAAEQYYGIGRSTVEGYIKGIQSMRDIAATEMGKLMQAAVDEAKRQLRSKSPSQVFADIGVDTMAGYIQGVEGMTKSTVDAIGDVYSAVTNVPSADLTTPQVKPGYANAGTLAQTMTTLPPQFNVRVYIGNQELTDILNVIVDNADSTRARALYAGRR